MSAQSGCYSVLIVADKFGVVEILGNVDKLFVFKM